MKGFICTCNGNEKQCIREAYNILNEFADQLYGEETSVVSSYEIPRSVLLLATTLNFF